MFTRKALKRFFPWLLVVALSCFGAITHAESTQATMHLVYAALSELLPGALDEQGFEEGTSVESMESALEVLERSAHALQSHSGESTNAEFSGLARSFESNVALLRQTLEMGRFNEFNYLALDLTHNCVSCHSRLPSANDFEFSKALTEKVQGQLYSRLDHAQLQIATRQFGAALDTLQKMILDSEVEPLDLELDGVLFDFLMIGIGVQHDLGRVINTLDAFRQREDTPYYLQRYAGHWSSHIEELQGVLATGVDLDDIRKLFDRALDLSPVPSSQVRVVYDLVISSLLRQLLEAPEQLTSIERAEIYWMLAVISIRTVNPRPGVPHTELLLDAAIRTAPDSDYAKHAYALLEEYNRVSFAGIPAAELPLPMLDMESLRKMVGVGR